MRVLIISCEPFLTGFLSVMNKDLDVAAIIMPNDKLINGFPVTNPDGKTFKIYSYVYLKECLSNLYYDYIILAFPPDSEIHNEITDELKEYKVDPSKLFHAGEIYRADLYSFFHMFNYVRNEISKYKILITGVSYAWKGTDINCFEMPALNCAMRSQDLYFDYLVAKKMFSLKKSAFKYAIIGVNPYTFYYDESRGGGR